MNGLILAQFGELEFSRLTVLDPTGLCQFSSRISGTTLGFLFAALVAVVSFARADKNFSKLVTSI